MVRIPRFLYGRAREAKRAAKKFLVPVLLRGDRGELLRATQQSDAEGEVFIRPPIWFEAERPGWHVYLVETALDEKISALADGYQKLKAYLLAGIVQPWFSCGLLAGHFLIHGQKKFGEDFVDVMLRGIFSHWRQYRSIESKVSGGDLSSGVYGDELWLWYLMGIVGFRYRIPISREGVLRNLGGDVGKLLRIHEPCAHLAEMVTD
jgi:hypothetical protein